MKKLNAFLLILLSIVMIVSCPDNGADKPKTFSITYKSNIDGVDDITETYTVGEQNYFPSLSFGVNGKYVIGYAATKTLADSGVKPAYDIGSEITFNSDKIVYAVWEEGEVYTLSLNPNGATDYDFDNLYYKASPEDQKGWFKDVLCQEKIEANNSYSRPEYNKTLKFNSNMNEVANPSDMQRKWNVYYKETPDVNDYNYYFAKSSDPTKTEDVFDITKTIDKNTTISISWVEQQQTPGLKDHTYDLPFVYKEGKWFKGWRKPNNALFEKFDSDGSETLTLAGSWMDEVTKSAGTAEASEEMVNTLAKIIYVWSNLIPYDEHIQTIWSEEPTSGQFIVDLYSMESPYKSFNISRDSRLYLNYLEGNINDKDQVITYLQFNGKIDNQKYEIEYKIVYDEAKKDDAYEFVIVNGVSYDCKSETFEADLNSALQAISQAERG